MWIDSRLAQPATRYEHTSGRFTNLLRVLHDTPEPLWPNVHIKAFWKPAVSVTQCEEAKPAG